MRSEFNIKSESLKPLTHIDIEKINARCLTDHAISRGLIPLPNEFADQALRKFVCTLGMYHARCRGRDYQDYLNSFVEMCRQFVVEQMYLERHRHYRHTSSDIAYEKTLGDEAQACDYLEGLLLTQAFWANHRDIVHFFRRAICFASADSGRALEVPSGTGFFLADFLQTNPEWQGTAVDLNQVALDFSAVTHKLFQVEDVTYKKANIFDFEDEGRYDLIICGELIEHVDKPAEVLKILKDHLKPGGKIFLTTAIWAASPDHVYLFHSAQEVRELIEREFLIEEELVLPIENDVAADSNEQAMNYAAVLTH